MTASTDQPTRPRSGEELDRGALQAFLTDSLPEAGVIEEVSQFPGGASNLTYLVRTGGGEFVLRRPPFGTKAATAHDMGREYRVLSRLKGVFPYCPEAVVMCDDCSVLGEPFYLMRRISGLVLRKDLPPDLALSADRATGLCRNLVAVHLELHHIDYVDAGLGALGKPEGYAARQVEGWSGRYRNARTGDVPDNEGLMDWLGANQPATPPGGAIVHNDFKFDNLVLDPDELAIVGVLDWEMATLGDPLMDLGCSLAYWVQADDPGPLQHLRMMPTHLPGMMTRRQILECYSAGSGLDTDDFRFYYAFGLFRLAVIVQQIYFRYSKGQTRDERFAGFGRLCKLLSEHADAVIRRTRAI
jgi:aminoglycoside phosphotransferase (APT) family kinase protein